ncbi:ammonium transporter [Hydromonas duriensis]|uniref:Ammonium transporter n=1 Tax=Hydromonas duriensis TaxID=1527608 RepID=A0A4V3DJX7_9BURK|nr:ammonium transporter [Hydromonas duriensis]TDR31425.1 ammonium transporter [Hydromonas duriensis]
MFRFLFIFLLALVSRATMAQAAPDAAPTVAEAAQPITELVLDRGDTAFMLVSAALVLLMTPALAFFYGGLSRSKSVLNTMMMSITAMGVVTLTWVVIGFSIAFGDESLGAYIGSFANIMLKGMDSSTLTATFEAGHGIPKYVFVMFQATFAIISAALISGALVDRMKFSAYLTFITLWSILVYSPVAHWVWDASGWLFSMGALDFAGGTVVHINAGVSALVAAALLGPRLPSTRHRAIPHNIPFVMLGAGLLWFGWFGFNAGSALGSNGSAGLAMITTQVATAAAMMMWLIWEKITHRAMSAVGAATGAVVGLVAITPAAGVVSPAYAILIGMLGATGSFWAVQKKRVFKLDDALDVFACHGVAGIIGAVSTGAFAFSTGQGKDTVEQVLIQLTAVGATVVYSAVASYVILKGIDLTMGLRISKSEEMQGIDIISHEEAGYTSEGFGFSSLAPVDEATGLTAPVYIPSKKQA